MKKYILCGRNAVTDEELLAKLYPLIEDATPHKIIRGEDLSDSNDEFCYAYLFFKVMYDGELVEIVDEDVIEGQGTVGGMDLVMQEYIEIPDELL